MTTTSPFYCIRTAANINADIQRGFSTFENPDVFLADADYVSAEELTSDEFSRFLSQASKAGSVNVDPAKYSDEADAAPASWKRLVGFFVEQGCGIDMRHNTIAYHAGYQGFVLTHGTGLSCYSLGQFETEAAAIEAADACGVARAYCVVPKTARARQAWEGDGTLGAITYGYGQKTRGTVRVVAELEPDAFTGRSRYLLACTEQPVDETVCS